MKKIIILLIALLLLSIIVGCSCSSQKDAAYEYEAEIGVVDQDGDDDIIDEEPVYSEYEYEYTGNDLNSLELSNERTGIIEEQIASIEENIVIEMPPVAREMILGTLVYDMDTAFYYDVISRVTAKISSRYHVEITPEIIMEFNPAEENLEEYGERLEMDNIVTSEVMDMKLYEITPGTFTISLLNSNNQTIEEGWTTWEWSVLPLKPGKYNLRLVAIVKDEHEHSNDKVVFDKEIHVQVQNKASWYLELFNNSLDLLQGYWFVLTALIVPLVLWIRKRYKKKKD